MGVFLNPGDAMLRQGRNSKIYVDKSALIAYLNSVLNSEQKYVCVSRPRRFGKSMAANMVSAYYDRSVDGRQVFHGLQIAKDSKFDECRNRYDVIKLNIRDFLSENANMPDMLQDISESVLEELGGEYPDVPLDQRRLARSMAKIFDATGRQFVIVIDEWDAVFRVYQHDEDAQRDYLDFLRLWLKDRPYVALAYMTGILPIKKYGEHSALNMFSEFSMADADVLAPTMGFTDAEVRALCREWNMPYDETRAWYDGYLLEGAGEIYSPQSIVEAMTRHAFGDYWNSTETYEALKVYLDLNYDGLRDAVVAMMAGDRHVVNIGKFSNDMTSFVSADDVLALLVHLGYLAYDQTSREVFVPTREVMQEFVNSTDNGGWNEVARAVRGSGRLLQNIIAGNEDAVAAGIEVAHQETSHLTYNDENALAYTLSLGLYAARQWYDVIRELPAGKGFADLVFIPRRAYADRPAIVAELKWDESAETAIEQIHQRRYPDVLEQWRRDGGQVILAGVSYDKKTRKHSCIIERVG